MSTLIGGGYDTRDKNVLVYQSRPSPFGTAWEIAAFLERPGFLIVMTLDVYAFCAPGSSGV